MLCLSAFCFFILTVPWVEHMATFDWLENSLQTTHTNVSSSAKFDACIRKCTILVTSRSISLRLSHFSLIVTDFFREIQLPFEFYMYTMDYSMCIVSDQTEEFISE